MYEKIFFLADAESTRCSPGFATSPMVLEGVFCTGDESSLLDCRHERPTSSAGCRIWEDAGVRCVGAREW